MRKIFLPIFLFTLFIFSCNEQTADDENQQNSQITSSPDTSSIQTNALITHHVRISSDSLKKMKNYFKNNFRRGDSIITKFNREDLINILNTMTQDSVFFVVGLYLNDVTEPEPGRKKKKPVIFLQKSESRPGFKTDYWYYEGTLCPLPDPCSIEPEISN